MKLKPPTPPLPKSLQTAPRRPGRNGNGNGNGHANGAAPATKVPAPVEASAEAGITVADWVDERTSLSGGLRWLLFRKVPQGTNWWYTLGSATMFVFLSQAVTGVFLAMYYQPTTTGAFQSIQYIDNEVFLGPLVRGMHYWGSATMVVLVFVHAARTFFFGAYKYPRELNWVIGVVLLILTMVMGFTGYLLPFDQKAYWATIVGVNINGTGPFIGPYLSDFLRGGAEFGGTTLSRFYSIHMLIIPGILAALIGAHLYLVAKLGTTAPPWQKTPRHEKLHETEV